MLVLGKYTYIHVNIHLAYVLLGSRYSTFYKLIDIEFLQQTI